jgi:hypothetical protein
MLVAEGGTAAYVISAVTLMAFLLMVLAVWRILSLHVAHRGLFGLRYFVGPADQGQAERRSRHTQVRQTVGCSH